MLKNHGGPYNLKSCTKYGYNKISIKLNQITAKFLN